MSNLFIEATFDDRQLFNRAALLKQKSADEFEAHLELPSQQGLAMFTLKKENLAPYGLSAYDQWSLRFKILGNVGPAFWPFKMLRVCGFKLHTQAQTALANGYQCWSESPLLSSTDTLMPESFPEREVFGDSGFYQYSQLPGHFHSWSFTYTTMEGSANNAFYGALDEDLFSSIFEVDLNEKCLDIALECEGADLSRIRSPLDSGTGNQLLASWIIANPTNPFLPDLSKVSHIWMKLIRKHERTARNEQQDEFTGKLRPLRGYTSWYHRYNAITDQSLLEDLAGIKEEHGYHVFQVDDGYQAAVGDWLKNSPGFPQGIAHVFESAKAKGLERGIWCAPFIALEHSNIVKLHPEWVLKDKSGQPVVCGNHPLWGGLFFAMDTENEEFKEHIRTVLKTYFTEWGCTFLKADFLYAAARIPAGTLTRAQRAARAHQFLYEECKKHGAKLLSCGATLSSAYGRCDYSRIGPDVGESWENNEFGATNSREKVSTRATLVNTITRAFLDGVCFGNDPDVIILRDEQQQMSREQRHLLTSLNGSLGRLIFCSDPVQNFAQWQHAELEQLKSLLKQRQATQLSAICGRGVSGSTVYQIVFRGQTHSEGIQIQVNLNERPINGLQPQSCDVRSLQEVGGLQP